MGIRAVTFPLTHLRQCFRWCIKYVAMNGQKKLGSSHLKSPDSSQYPTVIGFSHNSNTLLCIDGENTFCSHPSNGKWIL